ncbi:MAG TPA: ABC-2 family transporter protein [Acidimicrobiales bacterium]|nr:ABC-2 family transporter protein [Acidimicrobiales bacterium]
MGELAAQLSTYRRLVGARIRADWQYRTSFVLFLLSQTLVAGFDFAVIVVIFTNVDALAGWSGPEVALLFGISGVGFALGDLFISQVERVSFHIKQGTFDQFLIRPVPTLLQISAHDFALRRVGRLVQPTIVLAVSLVLVDVEWGAPQVILVGLTLVSGALIFGAIWVITSSIAFWTVETQEIANSFTYGGGTLSAYPIDVLGSWLRRIVTFVVPLASVAFLPAAWLLDQPMPFGLPRAAGWSGPLVAVALVALARLQWRNALRHHRGTGS